MFASCIEKGREMWQVGWMGYISSGTPLSPLYWQLLLSSRLLQGICISEHISPKHPKCLNGSTGPGRSVSSGTSVPSVPMDPQDQEDLSHQAHSFQMSQASQVSQ